MASISSPWAQFNSDDESGGKSPGPKREQTGMPQEERQELINRLESLLRMGEGWNRHISNANNLYERVDRNVRRTGTTLNERVNAVVVSQDQGFNTVLALLSGVAEFHEKGLTDLCDQLTDIRHDLAELGELGERMVAMEAALKLLLTAFVEADFYKVPDDERLGADFHLPD